MKPKLDKALEVLKHLWNICGQLIFWQRSEVFRNLPEIFGSRWDVSVITSHDKVKILCISLKKSWQV